MSQFGPPFLTSPPPQATAVAAGAMVQRGVSCRGVTLKDYVVLTRLSSCLMAVGKGEKTQEES